VPGLGGRRPTVVPLATSAKAAEVLAGDLGRRGENLHKFLHELDRLATAAPRRGVDGAFFTLRPGDVVLVDTAGMAGTLRLDRLVKYARDAGAQVRLLGDPAQLSAVEAGGALRLLAAEAGATRVDQLHRFHDPDQAAATLRLRAGDPAGLDFYFAHGPRRHPGGDARRGVRAGLARGMRRAADRRHALSLPGVPSEAASSG
jgi:ATP-dependent exoDNAse (exonuclease V) alpha subunit